MGMAPEVCRRRGRPRKNAGRHPAGSLRCSPPPPPPRCRRPRRLLRVDFSDEGDESERETERDEEEEDEEEEDREERRRVKKKLKLLLKLHRPAPPLPSDGSDEVDGGGSLGGDWWGAGADRKVESGLVDCNYGGAAPDSDTPLPDKKTLESILDKIQRKDKYKVFADPVDLDQLPDYLEVIEHPMDFSTIRKKLAKNVYSNLEELEVDVFLVCTNAMQYNTPETIYYKQARSMQEVARKCFQSVRDESRSADMFLKPIKNVLPNSPEKDPPKISIKALQEVAACDSSSAAVVTINENKGSVTKAIEATGSERTIKEVDSAVMGANFTATERVLDKVEPSFVATESRSEKMEKVSNAEELPEKTVASKNGHSLEENLYLVDENRRATYNISEQSVACQPESIYSMLDAENKQLVAVGLDAEYSYARSLARFAATLGPSAWKIASAKIEQVLPEGVKFGPGWVGEYEPLPMNVVSIGKNFQRTQSNWRADRYTVELKEEMQNGELKDRCNAVTSSSHVGLPGVLAHGGHVRIPNSNAKSYICEGQTGLPSIRICQASGENDMTNSYASLTEETVGKPESLQFPPRQLAIAHDTIQKKNISDRGPLKDPSTENENSNLRKQVSTQNLSSAYNSLCHATSIRPSIISLDLTQQNGKISAGNPWKDRSTENGKANLTRQTPTQKLSSMHNGLSRSTSGKPQFKIEPECPTFQPLTGCKDEVKSDSLKGVWISKNQDAVPMKGSFSLNVDSVNMGHSQIQMNVNSMEIKDGASSCNQGRHLSGPMISLATVTNNSHPSSGGAAQVTTDPVKSLGMMPGIMPKVQNFQSSLINCTRQFIPPLSPINHRSVDNGTVGKGGVTNNESNQSAPINAWISIGTGSECKLPDASGSLKVQLQPEPNIYKPTCVPSLVPGMYQVGNGRQFISPSSPQVTSGIQMLPVSNRMLTERNDRQNISSPSFPLMFTSEISRAQHMFQWRGPVPHSQQRKSEDMLPPDLNIGFQSPGSPVQRSTGIHVDSQPDLALQL